jgi:hypothetical protein
MPYLKQRLKSFLLGSREVRRAWVCIADHFEPMWHGADISVARERVARWRASWPEIAARAPKDSRGGLPQYTLFYPAEEYRS